MATTQQDNGIVSLVDLAKLTGPDGKILRIAEVMTKKNQFIRDMHWQQGNETSGHTFARRVALPSIGYRGLNEGVESSKSEEETVTEDCGLIEGQSPVDDLFLKLNGGNEARLKKDMAFVEAFANEVEYGMFYNSRKASPKKWTGLIPRLDAFSGLGPAQSQVVASQVATSGDDQRSAVFIGWGEDKAYGIVPKGIQAGLEQKDMGPQMIEAANGTKFAGKLTIFNQWAGLCVEDYRYVARVCNIDKSATVRTGNLLVQSLVDGMHQIHDLSACRPILYVGRWLFKMLHQQVIDGTVKGTITVEAVENGHPVMSFYGIPIHMTDVLDTDETLVA